MDIRIHMDVCMCMDVCMVYGVWYVQCVYRGRKLVESTNSPHRQA